MVLNWNKTNGGCNALICIWYERLAKKLTRSKFILQKKKSGVAKAGASNTLGASINNVQIS